MGIRKVEMEKSAANFERFGGRERGRLFVEGNKRGPRMCDYCGRITCLWICPLTALLLLLMDLSRTPLMDGPSADRPCSHHESSHSDPKLQRDTAGSFW